VSSGFTAYTPLLPANICRTVVVMIAPLLQHDYRTRDRAAQPRPPDVQSNRRTRI
jgi:hypothetical protein